MSRKGWEKLEQKLEHAGTAGNDLLNFGLVSISTFHTYSLRFVVFWVILLWRWQSPNCWIWWLVCFGWGFVRGGLASQNTTSAIGSQRLANFMASNCTLMSRGGFASTPEISSMLPANSPCLNAFEEQCMHVTILHQPWNMLCCTCMLHIWTQLNRRMTCLLHLDKNLVANIQSVNVWSLNTCLILWMQAHTVVNWETFNRLEFSSWPTRQMKSCYQRTCERGWKQTIWHWNSCASTSPFLNSVGEDLLLWHLVTHVTRDHFERNIQYIKACSIIPKFLL